MNAKKLKEINVDSYDKWFERWYKKQDMNNKLKQSAMQGYTKYRYVINDNYSDYQKRRMNDERFVGKLREKLKGLVVYKEEPRLYERKFLGRRLGHGWTDPEVVISWKEGFINGQKTWV